ncbi:asparagine synthase (glutamine-hydrolyzing) [Candidatus Dependentiae bacterium]|nr:asparagine synthase (glutamine-hydrolyzing) [Candidatus Dependentiae bacterium]MBU4387307.1 asparagine synthase (glutamine-hydrolyzing) [Candidatus Dependentiae bacterium]MCG2756434.1 asparagine synthase (glutamine-hydrolyzing) [Candidatus Dependentiae bacterium]
MCGITGFLNLDKNNFLIDEQLLYKMREKISHRGPDDFGIWKTDEFGLGLAHTRLSIVDLSVAGHQPMLDKEKTVVISFNGEIYNHEALRKELELSGYEYFSNCDAETIIYAYKKWGIDFLNKIDGMFVIALFDILQNKFYLIRDRIGVKPVYYSIQNNILSFASEIKALFALPWIEKEIDQKSLYNYLTFMITPAPQTIYKDILKLESGTYLFVDKDKNIKINRYYSPIKTINLEEKIKLTDEKFVLGEIEKLLLDSVKKRIPTDVDCGVFLSGGLDSSLNVALMSKFTQNIKTFTVAFKNSAEQDDLICARKVSKLFNTDHHEILISEKEAFEFFESMVYQLDEPLADPVCIPFYYVSKLARDNGIKVVHLGEGADELFFGYKTYLSYKNFYDRYWKISKKYVPNFTKKFIYKLSKNLFYKNSNFLEILHNWANNKNLFWSGAISFNEHQKQAIFNKKEFDSFDIVNNYLASMQDQDLDFVQELTFLELKIRLPELLLMRADKMSMLNGLEAREPFLDYKLVEFMFNVPARLKVKNNQPKYLLKKVAEKYLPNEIIYRKKVGFASPIASWFNNGKYFKKYYKDLLKKEFENKSLFLPDIKNLETVYKHHESGFAVQKWTIQNFLTLKYLNNENFNS